jgi:hypothetical protein
MFSTLIDCFLPSILLDSLPFGLALRFQRIWHHEIVEERGFAKNFHSPTMLDFSRRKQNFLPEKKFFQLSLKYESEALFSSPFRDVTP